MRRDLKRKLDRVAVDLGKMAGEAVKELQESRPVLKTVLTLGRWILRR